MRTTKTLFEHESIEFEWTDRDLMAVERLDALIGDQVLIPTIKGHAHHLKAKQYVGVVRLGHHTIQILPKMYRADVVNDPKEKAREATANLLYMLVYAGHLPVREQSIAPLLKRHSDWFEILTHLFAAHLAQEWQRGAHHSYEIIQDDLPVLKGKWRIADQIRRSERRHIFPVAYDEFTADNALNRVFRFVVERLWLLTRDADNRQRLGELRQWMDEVTLKPNITDADLNTAQLTRLNRHYEPLLNLARLFLRDSTLQLAAGNVETFALVFDMNVLFQEFIAGLIKRYREKILPAELANCEIIAQSRGLQKYLTQRVDADKPHALFRLLPDLVFRAPDHSALLIMDTKYKRLKPADTKLGIDPGDLYQMHAYAQRFPCNRILLLYPQTVELAEPVHARLNFFNEQVVEVTTINLERDLSRTQEIDALKTELHSLLGASQ